MPFFGFKVGLWVSSPALGSCVTLSRQGHLCGQVPFNILSLSLIFVSLITMCSACSSLGLSCMGLCASWTWLTISLLMLGKSSAIISSSVFSGPFPLFSFWDPYDENAHAFNVATMGSFPFPAAVQ